ncbi:hypothetical protein B0O95_11293 [Mycetohabitans endofungorum]|uniref:Uncharacterized protein n=1 Tax=Mycetohabitans endofungorum TaxID=417203 RepID=A0A2P5K871_9BURK|nr:hypothetical protein B0O95_11293 [Mycetohabitans endofungorum]
MGSSLLRYWLGSRLTFTRFDPIRALYWSAVINDLTAVPIMALLPTVRDARLRSDLQAQCIVQGSP